MKKLELIVAYSKNNVIGKENKLLWNLKDDLLNFKQITSGKTVVMGRKTYESIGRPLPNRKNIILTRNKSLKIEGCEIVNSIDEVLKLSDEEIIIIGGEQIYNLFKNEVEIFHLTEVNVIIEGDAFFNVDISNLNKLEERSQEQNERNEYSWIYRKYIKNV